MSSININSPSPPRIHPPSWVLFIEMEKGFNIFVTIDKETENLIAPILNVKFVNGTAKRKGIIMRKQITPMIKERMIK